MSSYSLAVPEIGLVGLYASGGGNEATMMTEGITMQANRGHVDLLSPGLEMDPLGYLAGA